jgi:hypothetical protein
MDKKHVKIPGPRKTQAQRNEELMRKLDAERDGRKLRLYNVLVRAVDLNKRLDCRVEELETVQRTRGATEQVLELRVNVRLGSASGVSSEDYALSILSEDYEFDAIDLHMNALEDEYVEIQQKLERRNKVLGNLTEQERADLGYPNWRPK